jgi:hypothetical protein
MKGKSKQINLRIPTWMYEELIQKKSNVSTSDRVRELLIKGDKYETVQKIKENQGKKQQDNAT